MKLTKKLILAVNSTSFEPLTEEWKKGKKCYDELYKILKEIDKKRESK